MGRMCYRFESVAHVHLTCLSKKELAMNPRIASQMLGTSDLKRSDSYFSDVKPMFFWQSRASRQFAREQRLKIKEESLKDRERAVELRERQVETALRLFREAAARNGQPSFA